MALVSTFPPRRCGIAEYSASLARAVAVQNARVSWWIVAIEDQPQGRPTSPDVRFVLRRHVPDDYLDAADAINQSGAHLVLVQHEYGLFGGSEGTYLHTFLERIRLPVITTLHTVLRAPSREQTDALQGVLAHSDGVILLSRTAVELYPQYEPMAAPPIRLISHGIPLLSFEDPCRIRPQLGLEHRRLVLSSGLIGPGKGIETVIDALPVVLDQHPDVIYVILGATHPSLLREGRDDYRDALVDRVRRAGLGRHVQFVDGFAPSSTLHRYLAAADLYIAPYRQPEQVASGTLSTALGAGAAIIATPFGHARELLADGRGVLFPFGDFVALAGAINGLLADEGRRSEMRHKAYEYAQTMLWEGAADQHLEFFDEVLLSSRTLVPHREDIRHAGAPRA